MSNQELETLEREVELARGRMATDLARLRAAADFSGLKDDITAEARRTKDNLVGKAKDAARSRADAVFSEVKARIAANPGAALAIGAGIAWRLYKRPPIASLLVGAGLASLMRTDPQHPAAGADLAARAVDFAGTAKQRLDEFRAGNPAGRARDFARTASERAAELAETAREQVTELASTAREQVGEVADAAKDRAAELAETAREQVGDLADATRRRTASWRSHSGNGGRPSFYPPDRGNGASAGNGRHLSDFVPSAEDRDRILLGAAGVALAAAIGIAYTRRNSGE